MSSLLLPTFEMMGLTFAIGFFVALVIKLIASAADSLDFYSSHQQELLRLRRLKRLRQKVELLIRDTPPGEDEFSNDKREDFSRGINRELGDYRGYYHGVSSGVPNTNLLDYYYPEDTHIMYLQKQEEMLHHKNKKHSNKPNGKAK
nr:LapA family protein [uncultured Bacteroides sp.]